MHNPLGNSKSVTATDIVEATASKKRNKTQPQESTLKRYYLEE